MNAPAPRIIDTAPNLEELIHELCDQSAYAIDTEFVNERTYYADLALVQIGWRSGIAVIDPQKVDVKALARLFTGPGLAVVHAASLDLEIFAHYTGAVPKRLFDTQIAGAFLGHGLASLANLLYAELKVEISKSEQLNDWKRRPLSEAAIAYAATDVAHLLALREVMLQKLEARDRRAWVEDECERRRAQQVGPRAPDQVWWKLKGRTRLSTEAQGVAQTLAAYREREAERRNVPPRFVLADLALLAMAQRPPRTRAELEHVRSLNLKQLGPQQIAGLLEAVRAGLELTPEARSLPPRPELEAPAAVAALAAAWVQQRASEEQIDPVMLATRDELNEFLLEPSDGPLSRGFRHALVGRDLGRLVAGEVSVAVADKSQLVMVER